MCYSFEGENDEGPSAKKRCTASVVVDQPADPDKIVVDSVTDVAATLEEVFKDTAVGLKSSGFFCVY